MRLKAILSEEPRALLEALESIDIKTDEDLLISSSELPALYRRLPSNSMPFAQLERLWGCVLDSMAATDCNGAELLESELDRSRWKEVFAEMPVLGEILGSMDVGIVEISGARKTSKTVRKLLSPFHSSANLL